MNNRAEYMSTEDENIILFAFRYALERNTNACLVVLNKLRNEVDKITPESRQLMLMSIANTRRLKNANGEDFSDYVWTQVENIIKETLEAEHQSYIDFGNTSKI